jgi:hypothetical protein
MGRTLNFKRSYTLLSKGLNIGYKEFDVVISW